jgi:hypothetical protein
MPDGHSDGEGKSMSDAEKAQAVSCSFDLDFRQSMREQQLKMCLH